MEARWVEESRSLWKPASVEETLLERFDKLLWKLPFRFVRRKIPTFTVTEQTLLICS